MQELSNEKNALRIKDFDAVDADLIMAVFVILYPYDGIQIK